MENKIKSIKIIFYFLLSIIFVKPRAFEEIDLLDNILNLLRILCGCIVLYSFLRKCKYKVSKFFLINVFFWGVLVFSTLVNKADVLRVIMYMIVNLSIIAIIEMSLKEENLYRLDIIFISYFVLILINFILLIIFPDGLYIQAGDRGNFLNIDNLLGHILILNIMLSLINIVEKRYMKISIINLIICILTVLITWSVTAVVSVGIFIVLMLFKKNKFLTKIVNINVLLVMYCIFWVIVIFNGNSSFLGNFVTNVLKKDLTFSGRTYVWDEFFYYIKNNDIDLFFGNGVQSTNQIFVRHFKGFLHLHNQFYNIIYEGGLFSLIIYVFMILDASQKIVKSYRKDSLVVCIITNIIFAYLIFMTMEINRDLEFLTYTFSFAYFINSIQNIFEKEKKKW